jgi:hypothetical protein
MGSLVWDFMIGKRERLVLLVVLLLVCRCYSSVQTAAFEEDAWNDGVPDGDGERAGDSILLEQPPEAWEDGEAAPSSQCLVGPAGPVAYNEIATFHDPSGQEEMPWYWLGALASGNSVIATASRDLSNLCFVRLAPDLTTMWSSGLLDDLNPGYSLSALVRLEDGLALFEHDDGNGTIRWVTIDEASGDVSPVRETEGWAGQSCEGGEVYGAVPGGGFIALWNDGWEIRARGYDENGVPRGDVVLVSDNGRYPRFIDDPDDIVIAYHRLTGISMDGPMLLRLKPDGEPEGEPTCIVDDHHGGVGMDGMRVESGIAAAWPHSFTGGHEGSVVYAVLGNDFMPQAEPMDVAMGYPDDVTVDGEEGDILITYTEDFSWLSYVRVKDHTVAERVVVPDGSDHGIFPSQRVVYVGSEWILFWTKWNPHVMRLEK